MVKVSRNGFIFALTALLTAGLLFSACSKKPATKPAINQAAKEVATERENPGPTTVSPEERKNLEELAKKMDTQTGSDLGTKTIEPITSRHAITLDEIKTLKKYGPFMYPDSSLMSDKSFGQTFGEGTEIYKMDFTASVAAEKVINWYKSNLESGVRITPGTLGDGSTYTGFEVKAGDGSWYKNITVKSFPGTANCTISVNLNSKGKPPEKDKPAEKPSGR
jgi:hypothetical protein